MEATLLDVSSMLEMEEFERLAFHTDPNSAFTQQSPNRYLNEWIPEDLNDLMWWNTQFIQDLDISLQRDFQPLNSWSSHDYMTFDNLSEDFTSSSNMEKSVSLSSESQHSSNLSEQQLSSSISALSESPPSIAVDQTAPSPVEDLPSSVQAQVVSPCATDYVCRHCARSFTKKYLRTIATVGTVMKEICRRFDEIKDQKQISQSTRYYITGKQDPEQLELNSGRTIIEDLYSAEYFDALRELKERNFFHPSQLRYFAEISSPPSPTRKYSFFNLFKQRLSTLPEERQPLIQPPQPSQLPLGWERIPEVNCISSSLAFFRESITGSITLKKPSQSLLLIRQIALSYSDPGNQEGCYIDITAFISPESSRAAKEVFDRGIGQRFRSYDDAWFNMEQYGSLPSDDVLKALRDPWQIISNLPSFADRIKVPTTIFRLLVMVTVTVTRAFLGVLASVVVFGIPSFLIVALVLLPWPWDYILWPAMGVVWLLICCYKMIK
ncbi:hypothetical protein EG329_003877 [Mollisiaceae sp. DMI_Dod_QoI]|nr:hypothetical protein EG329_003877 [Helotiales sp. DMI_Dod_QoI]